MTKNALVVGTQYTIEVKKTSDNVCIRVVGVDAGTGNCVTRTVPAADYQMKAPATLTYSAGPLAQSQNYKQTYPATR